MSLRKAEFEIVTDTNGTGYDDIHLRPSIAARTGRIEAVVVDRTDINDDSDTAYGFAWPTITINELVDVSNATLYPWNDSAEDLMLSRQLFFVDTKAAPIDDASHVGEFWAYSPRKPGMTEFGEAGATDVLVAPELIRVDDVRCLITDGGDAQTWRVTMYYETAGDYRF
jgi:hypothetical protein